MSKPSVSPGFHALSEPIRLQIIDLLQEEGELCVSAMGNTLGLQQSKISFHLKILYQCGLVSTRKQGKHVYYSLNIDQFSFLETYLSGVSDE